MSNVAILISGNNGVGKTALSILLYHELEGERIRCSFAGAIKRGLSCIILKDTVTLEKLKRLEDKGKYCDYSIREWLIAIGQGVKNYLDKYIWAKVSYNECKDYSILIYDDYRFPEEKEYLENQGLKIIQIEVFKNSNEERFIKIFKDNGIPIIFKFEEKYIKDIVRSIKNIIKKG